MDTLQRGVIIRPIEERDARDFVRGVSSGITPVVNSLDRNWSAYLPSFVPQKYAFDCNNCTGFSFAHTFEIQLNWLKATGRMSPQDVMWFQANGYIDANGSFAISERFAGIMAGTTINGNSPFLVWKATTKYGILPRADLSYSFAQSTKFATQEAMCADYYQKSAVTPAMAQKALQALSRLVIQYEWIGGEFNDTTPLEGILDALQQAPIQIAVPVCLPSWNLDNVPLCGIHEANHAVTLFAELSDQSWDIFDHYQPRVKDLSKDYYIPQAVLGVVLPAPVAPPSIAADQNQVPTQAEISWFSAMLAWIGQKLVAIRQPQGVGKVINDIICDSSHNMDTPAVGNMMTHKSFGILSSSENPQKLAATVTGLIISLSSLIIFFAGRLGFPLTVEQITTYAGALGTSIGAIWTLFGIIRKVVIAVQQKLAV